jgi:4-hydroxy-3-polyprenylbenzoate decarboxylase
MKMTMVPEIVDMDMPVEGVFHNLVIAELKKDYAGQGQKVMNAMWGAGQMMFNKILVLTAQEHGTKEHFKITEYEKLAQYVFRNLNPATDVYFSQGPMDVLDHSCSKLGFGGKMCIDGTFKFDEERDETMELDIQTSPGEIRKVIEQFPAIKHVNTSLINRSIPVIVVSVKKERKGHVRELHRHICEMKEVEGIKMILYVEHTVDANDLTVALWRLCNNLDPKRDQTLVQRTSWVSPDKTFVCLGLDGTIKTKEFDNFQRDWPNIIVSNDATIKAVDEKWERLGLGAIIPSPSLKFKDQMYGEEAVVNS